MRARESRSAALQSFLRVVGQHEPPIRTTPLHATHFSNLVPNSLLMLLPHGDSLATKTSCGFGARPTETQESAAGAAFASISEDASRVNDAASCVMSRSCLLAPMHTNPRVNEYQCECAATSTVRITTVFEYLRVHKSPGVTQDDVNASIAKSWGYFSYAPWRTSMRIGERRTSPTISPCSTNGSNLSSRQSKSTTCCIDAIAAAHGRWTSRMKIRANVLNLRRREFVTA